VAVKLKGGHAGELRYKQGGRTKTTTKKNCSASGETSFDNLCRCDFKRIGPKRLILWNTVYVNCAVSDVSHERCWLLGGDSLEAKGKNQLSWTRKQLGSAGNISNVRQT